MKVIAESDSNSYMSVEVFGGGDEDMVEENVKKESDEKSKLTESERKVWGFCNTYIEKEISNLNRKFKEYDNKIMALKENMDELGKITIEDLEKEARFRSYYALLEKLINLREVSNITALDNISEDNRLAHLDNFKFVLMETKNFIPQIFEHFEDNFNENGEIKDLSMTEIYFKTERLRYLVGQHGDERIFANDKIWAKIRELEKNKQ